MIQSSLFFQEGSISVRQTLRWNTCERFALGRDDANIAQEAKQQPQCRSSTTVPGRALIAQLSQELPDLLFIEPPSALFSSKQPEVDLCKET